MNYKITKEVKKGFINVFKFVTYAADLNEAKNIIMAIDARCQVICRRTKEVVLTNFK